MRPFQPQILRSAIRTPQHRATQFTQHLQQHTPLNLTNKTTSTPTFGRMASTNPSDLKIENTNIQSAPGVTLSDQQRSLVGSVLDLFAGRPSLAKLQLWKDDAVFEDPIAKAQGRKEYEPQWYGLQTAFSEIERLRHEVKSAGNPIEMEMETRYVIKGVNAEKIIKSVVLISTEGDKITRVQDKWNGNLPDGTIANAFRRLNATSMPHVVSVPKNAEEDKQRGN